MCMRVLCVCVLCSIQCQKLVQEKPCVRKHGKCPGKLCNFLVPNSSTCVTSINNIRTTHHHYTRRAQTSSTGVSVVKHRSTCIAPAASDDPRLHTTTWPLTYSSSSHASDVDGLWRSNQNSPYRTAENSVDDELMYYWAVWKISLKRVAVYKLTVVHTVLRVDSFCLLQYRITV